MMNSVNRAIHHLLIRAASLSQALGFAFDLIAGPKPITSNLKLQTIV
jgi:hypothetical protein